MTKIFILRKDFDQILLRKELDNTFRKGNFGDLIRKLI